MTQEHSSELQRSKLTGTSWMQHSKEGRVILLLIMMIIDWFYSFSREEDVSVCVVVDALLTLHSVVFLCWLHPLTHRDSLPITAFAARRLNVRQRCGLRLKIRRTLIFRPQLQQWRRQRSKGARSLRGQKILKPCQIFSAGCTSFLKKVSK